MGMGGGRGAPCRGRRALVDGEVLGGDCGLADVRRVNESINAKIAVKRCIFWTSKNLSVSLDFQKSIIVCSNRH